jgi:putative heme-binding domain-containing protein
MLRILALALSLTLSLALSAFAQKSAKVPDTDPEVERKSFVVAPGFEVNLFAADPMLAKPIQMNWDAAGRLWLATSETYPQIKPGQAANDKIIILNDADGDGRADTTEVFADGLLIPTAVLPGDGGVYVANSTEIIHLSASKPGQKADRRRVVLSGFGTEDTHHLIHTFRWGPDGAMYFNQSVYIHSHIETPHGVARLNGGGIWRYEPKSQKLSVFARGFWNPWGLQFDNSGNAFATDGAYGEGIVHVVPGASYPTGGNQAPRVLHGMNPGSPKHCGLEIIGSTHFPDDWQGDMITNDFRGHRVCRFKLRDAGSSFESREMTEVIRSTHPAFRPIDVSIGPDGALYIADWYNPIIQHGEVDFRDPRRDTTHGRIWRVTAKGRPLVPKPSLTTANAQSLLDHAQSSNRWTRQMATLRLHESNAAEAHALIPPLPDMSASPYFMATDTPRQVLLKLRHLAAQPSAQSATIALSIFDRFYDRAEYRIRDEHLDYALKLTLQELQASWMPALINGTFDYGDDIRRLAYALSAVQSSEAVPPLLKLIRDRKIPEKQLTDAWLLVARLGDAAAMEEALAYAASPSAGGAAVEILSAIYQSSNSRKVVPNQFAALKIFNSPDHFKNPATKPSKCLLAGLWKLESQRGEMEGIVQHAAAVPSNDADRMQALAHAQAALKGLAMLGGQASDDYLAWIAGEAVPPPATGRIDMGKPDPITQKDALIALVPLNAARAAKLAVRHWQAPSEFTKEIVSAFLNQKNAAAPLAKELESAKISPDAAKIIARTVKSAGGAPPALVAAIAKAGGLDTPKPPPTAEEIKALVADVAAKGAASAGELIYRRKDLQCMVCHAISGAGGKVGPDLNSIGASAQPDYLVEALLLPNKAVKEGYHTLEIVTTDGKLTSGIKVRESEKEIVLRDKDGREITIPTADIDTKKPGRSLMPEGLVDSLTRDELVHLVKFLSVLGKFGAYEIKTDLIVRTWEYVDPTKDNLALLRRERIAVAADVKNPLNWSTTYSLVGGSLPIEEIPQFNVWKESKPQSVIRFKFNVTVAGKINLALTGTPTAVGYLNGKEFPITFNNALDLPVGESIVTFIIDREATRSWPEVSLFEVSNTPARISLVKAAATAAGASSPAARP